MASTVLPNGIIIPEKYSRDWYNDLYHNWQELDNLLGGGTPKDGTLTIQKNGTTVGTFSANQATDETINIEVPDVNDGTLTIRQNGTDVDTFSANSSSDKTVNIQCVDLASNQTVGGIKTFSNAPVVGSINLDGKTIDTDANGNMTFNGHIVDTIEEQGDGYIRYSNGLQVCFNRYAVRANSDTSITLPKPFINTGYISVLTNYGGAGPKCSITSYESYTITGFSITNTYGFDLYVNVISIGKWK